MESAEDPHLENFSRTRWSLVRGLHAPQAGEARRALTELALRYWYPVYAYVRRCGHAPEIAQDITRAFFQRVAAEAGDMEDAPRGRAKILEPRLIGLDRPQHMPEWAF